MKRVINLLLLALFSISSFAQVNIHLEFVPESTPQDAQLYLAGNINSWNPADESFKFEYRQDSGYWLEISNYSGQMEFKITRGSWETVEGNENGQFRPNRTYNYSNGDTLHLSVLSWEDIDGDGGGGSSTANEQVSVFDEAMYIPQLDRSRRVWVYLPQDYETTTKKYPVLYMHDGQNVFDASTSFAGEWEVDETLTQLENDGHETAIVVAVDNGGTHRLDEYSPFTNPEYGGGEGDAYLDFIVETLKPLIDSTYRTLPDAENTGIMGSSMGGLISHYAYFRNPEVFGRAGIFSPAYWFSGEFEIYTKEKGKQGNPKLYLLAGGGESEIASGTENMNSVLINEGFTPDELKAVIKPDGQHAEWFWAREFEAAFRWLFYNEQVSSNERRKEVLVNVYPNPAKDKLMVEGEGDIEIRIFDINGSMIISDTIFNKGSIDLTSIKANILFVKTLNSEVTETFTVVLKP